MFRLLSFFLLLSIFILLYHYIYKVLFKPLFLIFSFQSFVKKFNDYKKFKYIILFTSFAILL